ncbi:LOW QUALITY PROTEIN: protein yellow [Musca domestica]|uniref:Protein yellow n=1 Tax=Musca domestica TaxID=7370 RepID=A0A9J7D6E2_MUSDO|nr:LOW QUALITY PROTEIN: protein yellow [Musca domestica]
MKCLLVGLLTFVLCIQFGNAAYKLQERFNWKQLDFAFPNENLKQQALASGDYIPQNALPVGVEHWQNHPLFVTIPRWRDGIPATLTYINMDHSVTGSPALIPYPDWRSNTAGDCANSITTAYRIKVDECGRLWVLDTGTLGIGNTTTNPCPYAVNVFDLATHTRIRRYELRPEDTNANTFIANIAVDIGKSCDDAFAYFSDELGYGLIAYSWEQNKSWRFSGHSYFFPDPLRGDYNIAGLNFQWGEEGIFGMALSPIRSDGYRTMYFSPLASHRQFAVSTRILRDETRVEDSYHDFIALDERGPNSHTTARVMSEDGVELFNLIDQNSVGCWHSSMPYSPQFHGIVDRDDVGLVFPADVKIDENKDVWVLSDRMPVFLLSELDYNDVNFRIYTAPLSTLIEGTVCDQRSNVYGPHNSVAAVKPLHPIYPKTYLNPTAKPSYVAIPSSRPSYLPPYSGSQRPNVPNAFLYNQQHNALTYDAANGPHLFPAIAQIQQIQHPAPAAREGLGSYATSRSVPWWQQHH